MVKSEAGQVVLAIMARLREVRYFKSWGPDFNADEATYDTKQSSIASRLLDWDATCRPALRAIICCTPPKWYRHSEVKPCWTCCVILLALLRS